MSQPEIFYVLNSRWPTIKAYGLQVAKTCQGLKQSGANVRLIVPIRARHTQIRGINTFDLYGIKDRFRVIRIPSFDFTRLHLNSKIFFYIQQICFAVIVAVAIGFKRGVVFSRDPFVLYLLSYMRKNIFWEAHRFPKQPYSYLYQRLFRCASGIIVITHGLEKKFREHGVLSDRITVIADAVDPEEFEIPQSVEQARRELALPLHIKIIGYVGQLNTLGEEKGISDLLNAYSKLRLLRSDILLLIVGGTEEDIVRYSRKARGIGLQPETIIFAGHKPHGQIPLYLRAADILVIPYPDTEHFAHYMSPLKLFEYMAALKPIVSTDLPSIREVITDELAYFCRPGDADSMKNAILRALDDNSGVSDKIRAIRKILPDYTWRTRGHRILSFITALA